MAGIVVLYCLTSFVGGFTSVRMFRQMGGKDWVRCIMLTVSLFPVPVVSVFLWVNTIALAHGSTSALPVTAVLTVFFLFIMIGVPLTVVGGSMAKQYCSSDFNAIGMVGCFPVVVTVNVLLACHIRYIVRW